MAPKISPVRTASEKFGFMQGGAFADGGCEGVHGHAESEKNGSG